MLLQVTTIDTSHGRVASTLFSYDAAATEVAAPSWRIRLLRWVGALIVGCLMLAGCGPATDSGSGRRFGKPQVYVDSYPLAYFAQRIVGDQAEVVLPAPAGVDPAYWRPTADDIALLQQADLILLNGAGYANWTEQVSLPESRTVDTSAGFGDRYIEIKEGITHSHGPGGEHTHGGTAAVIWLDFQLAAEQARRVHQALVELLPKQADELSANFARLEQDLKDLDTRMHSWAEQFGDAPLVVSHPSYQYWARRYGLNVESVDWDPQQPPKKRWLARLRIKLAAEHPARWMIWEHTPVEEAALRVSELGLKNVVFDPGNIRPEHGDWLKVMRANLERMEEVTSR